MLTAGGRTSPSVYFGQSRNGSVGSLTGNRGNRAHAPVVEAATQTLRNLKKDISFLERFLVWAFIFCLSVGSRPSDHYFRSACWFVRLSVCLFVCAEFFSAVFDPILIKLGYMLYVLV